MAARVAPIRTARVELVPAGLHHLDAELDSPAALGALLAARIPAGWPPGEYDRAALEFFRARLAEDPTAIGWYGWYAIVRSQAVVIGAAGFHGPPGPDGSVEVGYSIVPESRGEGFATEIVQALAARAWSQPGVLRIVAHARSGNRGSIKVLEGAGFTRVGPGGAPGVEEYVKLRPA